MSLILVYIAIAFTVVALVLMVLPLVGSRRERVRVEFIEEELRMIEALAAQRSSLLQQLRDLEFDKETDKVSQEDYERFKRRYELQAVAVMRQLDSIRGGQNWDRLVDAELRRHLGDREPELLASMIEVELDLDLSDDVVATDKPEEPAQSAKIEQDEPIDAPDAEDAEDADSSPDGELICGSCGTDLASDDRFCRKCGASTPTSQDAAEASA